MLFVCRINKARAGTHTHTHTHTQTHTHTHLYYLILTTFPRLQWLSERTLMLRYSNFKVRHPCCVSNKSHYTV